MLMTYFWHVIDMIKILQIQRKSFLFFVIVYVEILVFHIKNDPYPKKKQYHIMTVSIAADSWKNIHTQLFIYVARSIQTLNLTIESLSPQLNNPLRSVV